MFDGVSKLADVFFNGRPADGPVEKTRGGVSIEELVKRGRSTVRVGKKYYSIEVHEVVLVTKPKK